MDLLHPQSKYPDILAFARANPLPATAEGLADGLMDVAALLIACNADEAAFWTQLNLCMLYSSRANPHPGAFLSNPALLPNTVSEHIHGKSLGSLTAGAFFSYGHYQDDSLGQALLLSAFSPRTLRPQREVALYAGALLDLRARGLIASAWVSGDASLEEAASGATPQSAFRHASFTMVLDKDRIAAANHLRTALAGRAVELALRDDKQGLFTHATRARLGALVLGLHARTPTPGAEPGPQGTRESSKSPLRLRI